MTQSYPLQWPLGWPRTAGERLASTMPCYRRERPGAAGGVRDGSGLEPYAFRTRTRTAADARVTGEAVTLWNTTVTLPVESTDP